MNAEPTRKAEAAAAAPAANSPQRGAARPLRIFIVENHDDTRFLLTLLLEQLGHTVRSAGTMQEALAELPPSNSDVLISDVGLPDGSGWDLLRQLQLERPLYAVAMSGFGMSWDREKSRLAGYRHHLLKPLEPNRLEQLLAEAAAELGA